MLTFAPKSLKVTFFIYYAYKSVLSLKKGLINLKLRLTLSLAITPLVAVGTS